MSTSSIGAAIRDYRKRQGLTQVELARQLGVTQNTISQYENGLAAPGRAVCLHLLDLDDPQLDEALRASIDPQDFVDRAQLGDIEGRLSTADARRVQAVVEKVKQFMTASLVDLFDSPDPRLSIVLDYLANRKDDRKLDEIVALIEGRHSGDATPPRAGNDFLDLMREFIEFAPQQEIEFFERHAHAIISIQRKERERRKKNALKAG